MDKNTITRFWSKVNKNGPVHPILGTSCWVWAASKRKDGYGRFQLDGVMKLAHRVSWRIEHGEWPTPCCLHRCDNPPCIRPDHLFEGNNKDNMLDAAAKGRTYKPIGTRNKQARLTDGLVRRVRRLYAQNKGKLTQKQIAAKCHIHQSQVSGIVNHQIWKHVI